MRLLLDTHIAVWAVVTPERLTDDEREAIQSPDNEVFISIVSLWEIAVKHALSARRVARSAMPFSARQADEFFTAAEFARLALKVEHIVEMERLAPLHSDPFDRMLVAQAKAEPMRLISHDGAVIAYF